MAEIVQRKVCASAGVDSEEIVPDIFAATIELITNDRLTDEVSNLGD